MSSLSVHVYAIVNRLQRQSWRAEASTTRQIARNASLRALKYCCDVAGISRVFRSLFDEGAHRLPESADRKV